jgi:hypothetical protein
MKLIWIAAISVLIILLTSIYNRAQFYDETKNDQVKIDSFSNLAKTAKKRADSLQLITDTLKQKRSVSIIEVIKWREKRLNDTFWGTLEDTAKITYLLQENDSLWRIIDLDTDLIELQNLTLTYKDIQLSAKDSIINRTQSGLKTLEKENLHLKSVNKRIKTQRPILFLGGVIVGFLIK